MTHECDILIIGAGPAGLYAAYYAGFRGWSVVVMDALPEAGGQITAMYPEKDIFDVAGYTTVKGRVLVENLVASAAPFSPTYVLGEQAVDLDAPEEGPVTVTGSAGTVISAKAVIITGGIGSFTPRALPADDGWAGRGLVYFVPQLAEHADKDVVIVGGGDSAFDWAYAAAADRPQREPRAPPRAVPGPRRDDRHGARHGRARCSPRARSARSAGRGPDRRGRGHPQGDRRGDRAARADRRGRPGLRGQHRTDRDLGRASCSSATSWWTRRCARTCRTCSPPATSSPTRARCPLISVGFGEAALAVNNAAPDRRPGHGDLPGALVGGSSE